ncbi:MAG: hypothetical protein KDD69_13945, partial [Bdellovibrionales bacterium]|nr:hypothetical protein [Bdellovibrionales bacterium]
TRLRAGSGKAFIGLQENDVLTAVGIRLVKRNQDLQALFADLQRDKQATLTLERNGQPHKILYYLGSDAGPSIAVGNQSRG